MKKKYHVNRKYFTAYGVFKFLLWFDFCGAEILFEAFSTALNAIYLEKKEVLPLESNNHQIRSGINTIQGFCELIIEGKQNKGCIEEKQESIVFG